jgi:predicted RecA/RadA family phage recombinase
MHKLDTAQLQALGAPVKGGAQQIEDWLRGLLEGGTVRLACGLVELRGSQPVVTTLGDLKRACGVAMETAKQGLRALELEHWVLLVDGAHTRLLGPPRFRVSVTKENIAGSVGRAIEVAPMDGLNPLESIDYDQLRHGENIVSRKCVLAVEHVVLTWAARLRLASGQHSDLKPGAAFMLAAGSQVRHGGRLGVAQADLEVKSAGGREVRVSHAGQLLFDKGDSCAIRTGTKLQLERSNIIRLSNGQTGLLQVNSRAELDTGEAVDWDVDSPWLARFMDGVPLVLLRRAVFAELRGLVSESCAGVASSPPTEVWRVVLGVHDCFLDGSIPFRAGKCSLARSPGFLMRFLREFGDTESLRERMAGEFGFVVDAADVRLSPTMFAGTNLRALLRRVATDASLNSELLSVGNKAPCWSQLGAYYRKGEAWPWEITREVYFTYVDVSYRQHAG